MSVSIKTNPSLWEEIKNDLKSKNNWKWNARLSQQLVLRYKDAMEERGLIPFKGKKNPNNSLSKWTREQWQYISPDSKRYLPKKLIETLTEKEKAILSKGKRLGKQKPWDDVVKDKIMKFLKSSANKK